MPNLPETVPFPIESNPYFLRTPPLMVYSFQSPHLKQLVIIFSCNKASSHPKAYKFLREEDVSFTLSPTGRAARAGHRAAAPSIQKENRHIVLDGFWFGPLSYFII